MNTPDRGAGRHQPTGPVPLPPMPPALAARPRDPRRGLPVPPVNLHPDPVTGALVVDFTTLNTTVTADYAATRTCSLCAQRIGYWCAFLGTPRAADLMQYADPPGCPDCLRAAVLLCPFITLGRHRRARPDRPGAGMVPPGGNGAKPDAWVLGITRQYRTVVLPEHGYAVYLPARFRTVETYRYRPDGRIDPTPTVRRG